MKALIFAAGLGTRLKPFTDTHPKALLQLKGMTLLEIAIKRLKQAGCTSIIINVHHFADQIIDFVHQHDSFGLEIAFSDEADLLLDTGGGLKKASWFLKDAPFFIYNADILTDLDLKAMYENHLTQKAMVSLAVKTRPSSRQLLFNEHNLLCGWLNEKTGEEIMVHQGAQLRKFAFSGIHVVSPEAFDYFPPQDVYSIIPWYLDLAKTNPIFGYVHDHNFLLDVGKVERIEEAKTLVNQLFPNLT
jgi:NDP-sugar pyrophosphorylase family protein